MTWLDLVALLGAGAAAGLINTVVGSGTLITFPTLLALGVPPVTANISNTVGLAPGSAFGPGGEGSFRLCFNRRLDHIEEAAERLAKWMESR